MKTTMQRFKFQICEKTSVKTINSGDTVNMLKVENNDYR